MLVLIFPVSVSANHGNPVFYQPLWPMVWVTNAPANTTPVYEMQYGDWNYFMFSVENQSSASKRLLVRLALPTDSTVEADYDHSSIASNFTTVSGSTGTFNGCSSNYNLGGGQTRVAFSCDISVPSHSIVRYWVPVVYLGAHCVNDKAFTAQLYDYTNGVVGTLYSSTLRLEQVYC
jgi:hypothetical protein